MPVTPAVVTSDFISRKTRYFHRSITLLILFKAEFIILGMGPAVWGIETTIWVEGLILGGKFYPD